MGSEYVIIPAAGKSSRLHPHFKPLLPINGRLCIERVVSLYKCNGIQPIVVTGYRAEEVEAVSRDAGAQVVRNPDFDSDMLGSIQCGLAALPEDAEAVFVHPGDMPTLDGSTLCWLREAMEKGGAQAYCPRLDKKLGHPLVLDGNFARKLLGRSSERGLPGLLDSSDVSIGYVDVEDMGALVNMNEWVDVKLANALAGGREDFATTIWLLRHGQVIQRDPRRFIGQQDLALDDVGREQVVKAGEFLKHIEFSAAYASPLSRCQDTAKAILKHHDIELRTDDRLKEIALGDWENLSVEEVQEKYPGEFEKRGEELATYRPAGGESFQDVQDRGCEVIEEIMIRHRGNVLVVAHGGFNRTILRWLDGDDLNELLTIPQDYCGLNLISRNYDYWRILRVNGREYL